VEDKFNDEDPNSSKYSLAQMLQGIRPNVSETLESSLELIKKVTK
jgi:hypothetical protein